MFSELHSIYTLCFWRKSYCTTAQYIKTLKSLDINKFLRINSVTLLSIYVVFIILSIIYTKLSNFISNVSVLFIMDFLEHPNTFQKFTHELLLLTKDNNYLETLIKVFS